jgi:hypothetical protein
MTMDMTRRGFLAGGAALGGLMASSTLPGLADDPSLFPGRGRFERLSLNYHEIKAGAAKPFTVLHISDTHLTAAYPDEGEWERKIAERRIRTFGGRQEEALRDSIAWAKLHTDYIVHTGDLIDFQSRANFDLVKKYYGEGGAMMFGCLGNHEHYRGKKMAKKDGTPIVPAVVPDLLKESYPFPNDFCSTVVNGVNFITIDDSTDTVSAEQATRFEAEVKKGLPILLCMHCPFPTREIVRAASRFWPRTNLKAIRDMSSFVESEKYKDAATRDFVAYLRAQPLLKGILCGHGHLNVVDDFSPTAKQYEVAGNFMFCGQEFTIS